MHHLPGRLGEASVKRSSFRRRVPRPSRRGLAQLSLRRGKGGWGRRSAPPRRWCPQGPPSPVLHAGSAETIQNARCQRSRALHVGRGKAVRWQGSKVEPSSPPGPPTAPSPSPTQKKTRTQNFCHTINIFVSSHFPNGLPAAELLNRKLNCALSCRVPRFSIEGYKGPFEVFLSPNSEPFA